MKKYIVYWWLIYWCSAASAVNAFLSGSSRAVSQQRSRCRISADQGTTSTKRMATRNDDDAAYAAQYNAYAAQHNIHAAERGMAPIAPIVPQAMTTTTTL